MGSTVDQPSKFHRNLLPEHVLQHTKQKTPSRHHHHAYPRPQAPQRQALRSPPHRSAGVGVLTPLYMIMPGAEERLSTQTTKWAPRWEKNISYFTPGVEKGVQRVEPPISRAVQRMDERLPLERMAKSVH